MKNNKSCVLFFVRYPSIGQIKKRLTKDLDEKVVADLYKCFIFDMLKALKDLKVPFQICIYPKESQNKFIKLLGSQYSYKIQIGKDLGDRMKNSFSRAFSEGFNKVILIGSDIPDLPSDFLKRAFNSLADNEAVIAPSYDGGYYLIGFNSTSFIPEVFENINWSTKKVFEKTQKILKKGQINTSILPKWNDIDTIDNLRDLFIRNRGTQFDSSHTMSYLKKLKDIF